MSHHEPTKTSEGKVEDAVSNASSRCPRSFASLEYEVRSDIQHLVRNRIFRELTGAIDGDEKPLDTTNDPSDAPRTPAEELQTLAREFMACVAEEKRCTSHRMRLELKDPLAPGVVIDTPGASLFFWRFWEALVDLATAAKPPLYITEDVPSLIGGHDWVKLAEARRAADAKMDRALEVVRMAQGIKCEVAERWSVWSKSGRWPDLPLLESMVQDYQFGLFSAISQHEDLSRPRIQRYVSGASLPAPDTVKRGPVRDLVSLRWKWLQLQRFSARLWNDIGRPEYFPHAIRVLDALAEFEPLETGLPEMPTSDEDLLREDKKDILSAEDNSPVDIEDEAPVHPPNLSCYYDAPEPFEEQACPSPTRTPVVLQLLLAEAASIWIAEATPALRRYIRNTPLNENEKTWFGCGQETQRERDERWAEWKTGLEAVGKWCAGEKSRMPAEATVVSAVKRALEVMKDVDGQSETARQACI